MDKVVLKAKSRSVTGKQVRALRRTGELPAVIYGHNVAPITISLNTHEATLLLNRLTASSLVTIEVEGKEFPALVREKQRNHVKGTIIHVDFQAVSLTEKIRADLAIVLTGLSPAVKDFNAILVTTMESLEVECFPQDLPKRVVVDISSLAKIGDGLRVRDILLSEKVRVLNEPDTMVVLATAPKEEKVEEVVAEVVEGTEEGEPEVIEKGKKEEEEEAEGKEKK